MSRTPVKLFLDEHIWRGLTEALHARGYDALHVQDVQRGGMDDDEQLAFAAEQGRAVLTYNMKDFAPLATVWYEVGRNHAGIILSEELEHGELLRRVEKMLKAISAEEMINAVRYLQEFK